MNVKDILTKILRRLDKKNQYISMVYHECSKIDVCSYRLGIRRPPLIKEVGGEQTDLPRLDLAVARCGELGSLIVSRRSRRDYSGEPLDIEDLAALLHLSVGITGYKWGYPLRAYPSAGALQPVEIYPVIGSVRGLEPGIYHFNPAKSRLEKMRSGDYRRRLREIALDQDHVEYAAVDLVLTAVWSRTGWKYGERGYRYAHLDVGFAAQNIYLVAEKLGLATVAVGAFYDDELSELLGIDGWWEIPMLIMPVGKRIMK